MKKLILWFQCAAVPHVSHHAKPPSWTHSLSGHLLGGAGGSGLFCFLLFSMYILGRRGGGVIQIIEIFHFAHFKIAQCPEKPHSSYHSASHVSLLYIADSSVTLLSHTGNQIQEMLSSSLSSRNVCSNWRRG